MHIIPEALGVAEFWLLVGISFATSFMTAAIGIGGGTVLLAVMAQLVPVGAVIPVHGLVQLGSNAGRVVLFLKSIDRTLFGWFLLGAVIGAAIGGRVVVELPADILRIVLGAFILYSIWGPKLKTLTSSTSVVALGGFLTTTLTMFVGATGPLVMSLLRSFPLSPSGLVGTMAACVGIQHCLKIVVFGVLGFAFAPWLPLIALMIGLGFLGTLFGRQVLLKIDPERFALVLKFVLTALALRLIVASLGLRI